MKVTVETACKFCGDNQYEAHKATGHSWMTVMTCLGCGYCHSYVDESILDLIAKGVIE